jgi:PhnB protein
MSPAVMTPYLFFTSKCEEALAFYAELQLGRVSEELRYPADHPSLPGKIFHARFEGPGVAFFASDNDDAEPMRGFGFALESPSSDAAQTLFAALGEGGTVMVPFARSAWGSMFGMVRDRFGLAWMINARTAQAPV